MDNLDVTKQNIAQKVRLLRKERNWTQVELASKLGLSQNRLSEIERNDGSFSAEQFLTILKVFNVTASEFDVQTGSDQSAALQNALAGLGASHLRENTDILPSEHLVDITNAIRESLVVADPRLLTALGPVIVENHDILRLNKLHAELVQIGLSSRLAWLAENLLLALKELKGTSTNRKNIRQYSRTEALLENYLQYVDATPQDPFPDILDPQIRSTRTRRAVQESSSEISKKRQIVSDIQPYDFVEALAQTNAN